MNYRIVFQTLGKVMVVVGVLMLLPMIVAFCYGESCWWAFALSVAICCACGVPLFVWCKPKNQALFSKEGLVIVGLSWFVVSLVGALPFVISGEIPNYIDALFETISGFTTTGASILRGEEIEGLSYSLLFWRSFTNWIGGMGVIVFVMALVSGSSDRSMHILRAEMPGPTVDKIVPHARTTAKILYLLYIGFTLLQVVLLLAGGMPIFDSIVHTFSTAGTGGFGIRADSVAGYGAFCQWVIAIFMILFGVNFNLYYLAIMRKFRTAFSSRELWIYLGIVVFSTMVIGFNVYNQFAYTQSAGDTIRYSFFQTASFLTTTGFTNIPSSSSINDWSTLSKVLLFLLMFVGGCAGSTAGGLKVSRIAMLFCACKKSLRRVLHPRNANAVKFEGKVVSEETLQGVTNYFAVYMVVLTATFLLLSFDGAAQLDFQSNLTAAVSCLNNIGPAYGVVANGYYVYNYFSKIVLMFVMLVGRLEIYPMLLTFAPSTWIKK